MELEKLKEFIDFMNEHNLSELEIEKDGNRVKLKKPTGDMVASIPQPIISAPAKQEAVAVVPEEKKNNFIEIKSPMVGTFYRAPSPGAKAYTDVGENIKSGDVVCIIEAMKLMNEIKAETSGKIAKITVQNGEPVEFGQILFLVEPL